MLRNVHGNDKWKGIIFFWQENFLSVFSPLPASGIMIHFDEWPMNVEQVLIAKFWRQYFLQKKMTRVLRNFFQFYGNSVQRLFSVKKYRIQQKKNRVTTKIIAKLYFVTKCVCVMIYNPVQFKTSWCVTLICWKFCMSMKMSHVVKVLGCQLIILKPPMYGRRNKIENENSLFARHILWVLRKACKRY